MQTIKKEYQVYSFDELNEEAQQKAYSTHLSKNNDYFWADSNETTLKAFAELFPVKIKHWSYDSTSGNVDFNLNCDDAIENLQGLRLRTYILNNIDHALFKPKHIKSFSRPKKTTHRMAKNTFNIRQNDFYVTIYSNIQKDNCCVLTGYCVDDDILQPIYDFIKNPNSGLNFYDLMQDCFNGWISACVADAEYSESLECFRENCEANAYQFLENGDFYH